MEKNRLTTGILRSDIRLLRGESLMLFDPASDAYYKISARMSEILLYFSEDMTLDAMKEKLHYNGITVEKEELLEICAFLRNNGLLVPRYGEAVLRRGRMQKMKKGTFFLRLASSYLFFRLPPLRPDQFFRSIAPYVSFLASYPMMMLWILLAVPGYLLAIRDLGRVMEQFVNTLSWTGLVKYVLAVVVVKLIHEAAHSLAAIRFHCRVRGIGLGFIFFVPRLYTDTTDSWRLPRKQRLLIDGAGILAELIMGGIAALCWNLMSPGTGQATMFYIFAVSTLSTLLVNGNIFIRYDGYYIFSDLLGIENLMGRAMDCVKRTWRWYFFRLGAPSSEKRRGLLICYGVSAFIYRIFLYTSICILIYCSFTRTLAVLMLLLEFYTLLLYPLAREVKAIRDLSRSSSGRNVWIMLSLIFLVAGVLLFCPVSRGITFPGETVPGKRSFVTVAESGYLKKDLPAQARKIHAGEIITELSSPQLRFAIRKIQRTLAYDRMLLIQQQTDEKDFSRKNVTERKIHSDELALQELRRRQDKLVIKTGEDGYFVPIQPDLSAGAFLRRNTVIGEIVSRKNIVYAYAGEDRVGKIFPGQKGYMILPDSLEQIPGKVICIRPVAVRFTAPSPVLQFFGGVIPAYQTEKEGFTPVQTLYCVELEIPENTPAGPGRLVHVKLIHSESLFSSVFKKIISFFRREF